MTHFEDRLWESVLDEHGEELAHADGASGRHRGGHRGRPRVLAAGTLGLAGVGAALVLTLSGSSAPPAFAITHESRSTVLVHLRNVEAVPAAEHQLAAMGIDEWFAPILTAGTATGDGTVTCTIPTAAQAAQVQNATHRPASGVAQGGTQVKVLLGTNGSQELPAGQATRSQPGGGPMHLSGCYLYSGAFPGDGNTGSAS